MTTNELPEWPLRAVQEMARGRAIKVWLVGGAVRDLMLERPLKDLDFAVDRDATSLARAVGGALDGFFFPLDDERGTARVVLQAKEDSRLEIDFALMRGATLEADLAGRDFTINAMALDATRELVDPMGGREDLEAKCIRGTTEHVFRNDPVRLLRAVRLEAELGFKIEPETEAWIRRDASLLPQPAVERLRDELVRGLSVPGASAFIRRLDDLSLLIHVLPHAASLKGVAQSYPHRFDVWLHTLRVVEALEGVVSTVTGSVPPGGRDALTDVPVHAWGDLARCIGQFSGAIKDHLAVEICHGRDRLLLLKLAALCHDVGKPQTRSVDRDGRIRFYGHESIGARMTASWMRAMRFSGSEVMWIRKVTEAHLRPAHLSGAGDVTRRSIYRFFRDTGDAGVDTVLLSLADHLATWGADLREKRWTNRLQMAEILLHHYFERPEKAIDPQLPIDGHDLMRVLDIEAGPEVGRLLDLLREAVAAGDVETREELLDLAKRSVR